MISIIAAIDENGLIGNNNFLPWNLPKDLENFKRITLNQVVVMGRKTFESIGKALTNRVNIVISKTLMTDNNKNLIIKNSFDEAIDYARQNFPNQEIFVIGGESVFRQAIMIIDKLYITRIYNKFMGDSYFPKIDLNVWSLTKKEDHFADNTNKFDYSFLEYEKINLKEKGLILLRP